MPSHRKRISTPSEGEWVSGESRLRTITASNQQEGGPTPLNVVSGLLDVLGEAIVLAERGGRFLFASQRAQQILQAHGLHAYPDLNLFTDLFNVDPKVILQKRSTRSRSSCKSAKSRTETSWLRICDYRK